MMFHYNAQHTGDYSPVGGPVSSNRRLLWNFTTGNWLTLPRPSLWLMLNDAAHSDKEVNFMRRIARVAGLAVRDQLQVSTSFRLESFPPSPQ